MELMPERAHAVILGFLGTGFLLGLLGLGFVLALGTQKLSLAKKILAGAVCVAGLYAGLLLAASLASKEKILAAGEWKYFCEADCHLAYTVTGVEKAKTLGSGEAQAAASGTFYVVTLKTWFDEDTTRVDRGNGLLSPNLRRAWVVDAQGRRYAPSLEGQKGLEQPGSKLVPLTQWLRPGDSYETTLVFDVPADAVNPRLYLTDPLPVNRLLIGHENSFLHKKIYFRLDKATKPSSAD